MKHVTIDELRKVSHAAVTSEPKRPYAARRATAGPSRLVDRRSGGGRRGDPGRRPNTPGGRSEIAIEPPIRSSRSLEDRCLVARRKNLAADTYARGPGLLRHGHWTAVRDIVYATRSGPVYATVVADGCHHGCGRRVRRWRPASPIPATGTVDGWSPCRLRRPCYGVIARIEYLHADYGMVSYTGTGVTGARARR